MSPALGDLLWLQWCRVAGGGGGRDCLSSLVRGVACHIVSIEGAPGGFIYADSLGFSKSPGRIRRGVRLGLCLGVGLEVFLLG